LLVFALPFLIIFVVLLRQLESNISATQQKATGLAYERPLMRLLRDALRLRNAANASLDIDPTPHLTPLLRQVRSDIGAVDKVDARLGPTLHTTSDWTRCKGGWTAFEKRTHPIAPNDVVRLFAPKGSLLTAFIQNPNPGAMSLMTLMANVADTSGLVLETRLDTYYLVDAGVAQVPALALETASIGDVGQMILGRGSMSRTDEEVRELTLRVGTIRNLQSELDHRMAVAHANNAALRHEAGVLTASDRKTEALLDMVTRKFIDEVVIRVDMAQYHAAVAAALDGQFVLYDTMDGDAAELLANEMTGWQQKRLWVELFAALVLVLALAGYGATWRSLAARLAAEVSLKESEARHRLVVDNALDAVIGMDDKGCIVDWNPQAEAIFGWSAEEAIGRVLGDTIIPPSYREAHERGLRNFLKTSEARVLNQSLELSGLHRDGREFPVELKISLVHEGQRILFSAFISDITDRKEAEAQLRQSALFDALTGLPNRSLFTDRLELALKRARRQPELHVAVLFIDLDHFKVVNDSLGHSSGDQLLVAASRRLEGCLRPGDTVARLGGDEFTILLEDNAGLNAATHVAERIQRALATPFMVNDRPIFISASIGIAGLAAQENAPAGSQLEALLRDADTAMYQAKAQGRACYALFGKAMHEQAVARLHLEADLRQALEQNEFEVYYQPIVQLRTRQVAGFEALVRWRHPTRGLVSPAEFIPVAEETGLIVAIDRWVLRTACAQLQTWRSEFSGGQELSMSVNLSGRHFAHPGLIEEVGKLLADYPLPPSTLKLEVTESAIVGNPQAAAALLRELQALGVQLCLDDFGTGYSSLSYLHRFPFDTLKIDRSFVHEMGHGDVSELVRTIVAMAHNLNLDVVAEGIETEEQAAQLEALECEYAQGYFFARPLDPRAAVAWLTAATPAPA
jgi:diguanylate cyclase (GGDEF)-like protein/PAS domain S-box-containing protein